MTPEQNQAIQRLRDFGVSASEINSLIRRAKRQLITELQVEFGEEPTLINRAGYGIYEETMKNWLASGQPELRVTAFDDPHTLRCGLAYASKRMKIPVSMSILGRKVIVRRKVA